MASKVINLFDIIYIGFILSKRLIIFEAIYLKESSHKFLVKYLHLKGPNINLISLKAKYKYFLSYFLNLLVNKRHSLFINRRAACVVFTMMSCMLLLVFFINKKHLKCVFFYTENLPCIFYESLFCIQTKK